MYLDLGPVEPANSSSNTRDDGDSGYTFESSIYALIGLVFAALTLTTLFQSQG